MWEQIVDSVVKVEHEFVLEIDKMLCLRAPTAVKPIAFTCLLPPKWS